MALLPYALRPSVIIRRKAIWQGVLGPSTFWKVVAVGVFGKSSAKKFFGKNPEPIVTETVGSDSFLNLITSTPYTKKQAKRSGVSLKKIETQAKADVAAAYAARPPKKKRFRRKAS